jgi:hypothetical protein
LALKKCCVLYSCRIEKKCKAQNSRYTKKPRLAVKGAIAGAVAAATSPSGALSNMLILNSAENCSSEMVVR